ncbi:MAG: AAA-like domain-containing protein [Proteobacteria bacterium]|nr:AAA-like domain-containing protein [Pseudomonadota bacterium]
MSAEFFQAGGSLDHEQPSYITRKADQEFYQALLDGEFCHVLNSQQMGKSSLRVRTAFKLQQQNIVCASIDISSIGTEETTLTQFYNGLIVEIKNSLELDFDDRTWCKDHADLSSVQSLELFIEEVLLVKIKQPIVIFIDESDSIKNLGFGVDDLFALIQAFHNKRADDELYKRLTFAILGVASPGDLIKDKKRTPFNIGRAINLTGFTIAEAQVLQAGLTALIAQPNKVMAEVLFWTGGQPFLTQKICKLISQQTIEAGMEKQVVADLVNEQIIKSWESQDDSQHLHTIKNRILEESKQASLLLALYQKILVAYDSDTVIVAENNPLQLELQLTGLIIKQDDKLQVYNPIYAQVFTQEWIAINLANLRPYDTYLQAWLVNEADSSWLLTGTTLAKAESWMLDKELAQEDYRFLTASRVNANKRKAAKVLNTIFGIAFVVILSMGLWAFKERQIALDHLAIIEQQQEVLSKQKAIALDAISNLTYESIEQLDDMPNTHDLIKWLTRSNLELLERINELETGDDTRVLREQAENLGKIGNAHLEVGEVDDALLAYQQSAQIFNRIYQANPQNADLKHHLAISYEKLGDIRQTMGQVDKALEFFELEYNLKKELYDSNLKSESLKNGLAISYEKLGGIYQSLGNIDQALKFFKLEVQLQEELYDSNPESESLKYGLAISYSKIGEIDEAKEKLDNAIKNYEKSKNLLLELFNTNPKSEKIKNDLAISFSKLGSIHNALGNVKQALKFFELFTGLMKQLHDSNPKNESLKNRLAISYQNLGLVYDKLHQTNKVLKYFKLYNDLIVELHELNPKNVELKHNLAFSYYKLGGINKDKQQAKLQYQKAIKLWQELYELNH